MNIFKNLGTKVKTKLFRYNLFFRNFKIKYLINLYFKLSKSGILQLQQNPENLSPVLKTKFRGFNWILKNNIFKKN